MLIHLLRYFEKSIDECWIDKTFGFDSFLLAVMGKDIEFKSSLLVFYHKKDRKSCFCNIVGWGVI